MPHAHLSLQQDTGESEVKLMAECQYAGQSQLSHREPHGRIDSYPANAGYHGSVAEELRQLRALAIEYRHVVDQLIGAN